MSFWSDVECFDDIVMNLEQVLISLEKHVNCQVSIEVRALHFGSVLKLSVRKDHATQVLLHKRLVQVLIASTYERVVSISSQDENFLCL